MIHWETITGEMKQVLHALMEQESLRHFELVGGTALALRYGHRMSVDFDLFTLEEFDAPALAEELGTTLDLTEIQTAENTVRGFLQGIKIDCIRHHYPQLSPPDHLEGVRIASVEDLAAMKLNAISNRGAKKDFWDLSRLLEEKPLEIWMACAKRKYASDSEWNIRKSLSYFEDAEKEPSPRDLRGMDWETVRASIQKAARLI